jgi:ribose transport system permease protein
MTLQYSQAAQTFPWVPSAWQHDQRKLLADGYPVWVSVLAGVLAGGILGTLTGLIIVFFDIAPFIASLATMVSARGLSMLTTDGGVISGLIKLGEDGATGKAFCYLGGGYISIGSLNVPFAGITWILLTLIAAYVLKYTIFGRNLYAIGGNKEAAMLSGVPVKRYSTLAYNIGHDGRLCRYYATAWLTVAQPTLNQGSELAAIAATVMGGTSMNGGKGSVFGTLAGVLILAIITNLFNLVGLPSYYQQIFKGIIIIGAMLINRFVSQKEN